MGLTAEKKRLMIRRVIFAVLLIFCAVIQNTPGLLPEPFGAHQLAVTVMAVSYTHLCAFESPFLSGCLRL